MSGSYTLILLAIFVGGSYIGRWLHRCVLRFPSQYSLKDQLRSIWHEGDCRSCHTRESGLQHLPVIGWLIAGRCRHCGRKMDARRPVVELLTGLLLAWLYWVEIPDLPVVVKDSGLWTTIRPAGPEVITELWSPVVWMHLRYLLHAVMLCGLIVATVIDLELCIIPDGCTVPAMIFAVLFSFAVGQTWLVPIWFQDTSTANIIRSFLPELLQPLIIEWDATAFATAHPHWHGLLVSLTGLIAGAGVTWLVRAIGFWALRREAMGDGDVVLMALIGAVIGWQPVLLVFMLSSALAVFPAILMSMLPRDSDEPYHLPYGPWLSLATVMLLLFWQAIWPFGKAYFDMGVALFLFGFVMFAGLAGMMWTIYIVKRSLGLIDKDEEHDLWSSADHLIYYGTDRPDDECRQYLRSQWPGWNSGRGFGHYRNWRNPK